jgi:orotidine-5'-phosphate decarboxylase
MDEAKERLIFALDVPDRKKAMRLVERLRDEVGFFKLGLELYLSLGPKILNDLANKVGPNKIFLDLKLYDIPATVLGAFSAIVHGLAWVTVPCDLGFSGLERIVTSTAWKVLAVTVLTSINADDLRKLGFAPKFAKSPVKLVKHKALLAQEAGCAGVVCSGREAKAVREACGPEFIIVCPGIRPAFANVSGDDQKRTVTPEEAIKNGADYIVVGRPIRDAKKRVTAARNVVAEIATALERRGK